MKRPQSNGCPAIIMASTLISNKTRIFEIFAVILTALGKFIFMDYLNWRFPFIVTAIILWSCYVIYRSRTNPGDYQLLGFQN